MIACDPQTEHVICGEVDEAVVYKLEAFSQVPRETRITFSHALPSNLSGENTVIACQLKTISPKFIFTNVSLVLVNSEFSIHQATLLRKYIPNRFGIPEFLLSLAGYFPGVVNVNKYYGMKNFAKAVLNKIGKTIYG